jgi:23S rRNA (pseudouridine1915-N3)-methyltransferase
LRLRVIKIGKVAYDEIRGLAAMYEERMAPFARVENIEIKDEEQLSRLLLSPKSDHPLVLLDERGKARTSREFAQALQKWTDDPQVKTLTFVIGGPMGASAELRAQASATFSLSPATFTSDLAWLLLWEQIYRGYNILRGTGYHHD